MKLTDRTETGADALPQAATATAADAMAAGKAKLVGIEPGAAARFAPAGLEISGINLQMTANRRTTAIDVIDGGGAAITAGTKGAGRAPFARTITAARLLHDRAGSIVVDIRKDSHANFLPTICAAARPESTRLTGWTSSIAAAAVRGFSMDGARAVPTVAVS